MNEFAREVQGNASCLVLRLQDQDQLDSLAMGMLENNRIPGLLPVNKRWEKQNYALYYTISSLTALQNCTALYGDERRTALFLRSFCSLLLDCEEYLLDMDGLLLDPEQVFVKAATGEIGVVYLPLLNRQPGPTPVEFLREVTRQAARRLPPDSALVHLLLMQELQDEFSPAELLSSLEHLKAPKQPPTQAHPAAAQASSAAPRTAQPAVQPAAQPAMQPRPAPRKEEPVPSQPTPPQKETPKHGLFDFGSKKPRKEKPEKARKKPMLSPQEDFDNPFAPDKGKIKPKEPTPDAAAQPSQEPQPRKYKGISLLFGSTAGQDSRQADPFSPAPSARQGEPQTPATPSAPVTEPPRTSEPVSAGVPGTTGYTIHLEEETPADPPGTIPMGQQPPTSKTPDKETFPVAWLEEKATGNRIRITHNNFHVGRKLGGEDIVDYAVVTATAYMGSDHCYFLCRDGQICLVDNNSFNGTWVDGRRVSPGAEVPLRDGAVIRMADVSFLFHNH